jgi:predicted TIM-barrel fold metal-dependent hydrolase
MLQLGGMTRREFLPAAVAPLLPEVRPVLPVTDCHQHLWGLPDYDVGWLPKDGPLAGRHGPEEYAQATAGLNVTKAVYMEVGVAPDQRQREIDYLVKLCESGKTPTVAAVVGGDPEAADFPAYLKQFAGSKYLKGIRRMLHTEDAPAGLGLRPGFLEGVQLLGDKGLSFDLCIRWKELPDMVQIVTSCPGTRFILDHCGNPSTAFTAAEWDQWRKGLDQLAACPNVVACKVSGFIVNAGKPGPWRAEQLAPAVDGVFAAFGPDRVVFGGDWPVVKRAATYKEWLTLLREVVAARPEAEQRKLFSENAARVYGI